MKCEYYDCGWCYAPKDVETNDKNGECQNPLSCPALLKANNLNKSMWFLDEEAIKEFVKLRRGVNLND